MKDERFAVVLGATGGIGQAISEQLAAAGWSLYLHYHKNEQQAFTMQARLRKKYQEAQFYLVQSNFLESNAGAELAKQVQHVQSIVVANGQSIVKLLSETTADEMEQLWKVHVQNPLQFIGSVSSQLRHFPTSYIVFIGSIWGITGAANETVYSAVKGAQHAFVKAYAKESAFAGTKVNAIAPGWIETSMNASFSAEDRQFVLDEIPLMSTGTPEQIASFVQFFLSGKADYMTGEIVNVNGGWHI